MPSNRRTVRDSKITIASWLKVNGELLNSEPPKYTISICIAVINAIIKRNALFFNMPKKINTLSLLAVKEFMIPAKINNA